MDLYNYLSKNDKDMICDVIEYEVGGVSASLEHILRYWSSGKKSLFSLLNNNLILEKDIDFTQPLADIIRKFEQETNKYGSDAYNKARFIRELAEKVDTVYIYTDNSDNNEYRNSWRISLYSADTICSNRIKVYSEDRPYEAYVLLPSGEKLQLTDGMKTMKLYKKLADAFNIPGYEDFRILQSQYTNNKNIKGKLCLSIHPLDYMTMSDNDSNWSSCMSWRRKGEYRQGTVEMMNSASVVVAYIKSTSNNMFMYHTGEEWNNKLWRELFIVHDDFIVPIKGYPYQNLEFEAEILAWLRELAATNWNAHYNEDLFSFVSEAAVLRSDWGDAFYSKDYVEFANNHNFFVCDPVTNLMYNDFGCSVNNLGIISTRFFENPHIGDKFFNENHQVKYYYLNDPKSYYQVDSFCYSGEAECMCCGDIIYADDYDEEAGFLACLNCDDVGICYCCGHRVDVNYAYYVDGECLCEGCYDEATYRSPFTKEDHLRDDGYDGLVFYTIEEFEKLKNSEEKSFSTGSCARWVIPLQDGISYALQTKQVNSDYLIELENKDRWWNGVHEYAVCALSFTPRVCSFFLDEFWSMPDNISEEFDQVANRKMESITGI